MAGVHLRGVLVGLGMCAIVPELWLVFQRGAEQGVWWSSRAVLTMMWWQNGADPGVQHVGMVWQGGVIYQSLGIANLQFSHSISTAFSTEYPKEIITRFIMWKWHSCNRVVHSKHFWAIFSSFSASFSVHFQPFWQ